MAVDQRVLGTSRSLARFHLLPQRVGDDPQFRQLGARPLGLRALPAFTALSIRILHPLGPVPNVDADVERIAEDAGAGVHVAVDRGGEPLGVATLAAGALPCRAWRGDSATVQIS